MLKKTFADKTKHTEFTKALTFQDKTNQDYVFRLSDMPGAYEYVLYSSPKGDFYQFPNGFEFSLDHSKRLMELKDITFRPEFQNIGLGTIILLRLIEYVKAYALQFRINNVIDHRIMRIVNKYYPQAQVQYGNNHKISVASFIEKYIDSENIILKNNCSIDIV